MIFLSIFKHTFERETFPYPISPLEELLSLH